jgi:metal-responsive CopG/Arc/MetJ family transcriptional regulator
MSKMTAVRLDERLLESVDRERKAAGMSRARVIHEALAMWLERRRVELAIQADQRGYASRPVGDDEFGPVLGAQVWPK